ncbi:AAA ATPase [Dionaea muscipula]
MPALADRPASAAPGDCAGKASVTAAVEENSGDIRSAEATTPQKRKLRSHAEALAAEDSAISSPPSQMKPSPSKWKSPRRCISDSPNSPSPNGIAGKIGDKLTRFGSSPLKKSSEVLFGRSKWNPQDYGQMRAVKEALHVSMAPSSVVCREDEYSRILDFCKSCMEQEKSGSLYVCGCPGTGKTMIVEKVKLSLTDWSKEGGFQKPDVLYMNCTTLTNPTDIFSKILNKVQPQKKIKALAEALKHIQSLYLADVRSSGRNLLLLIIDELDYLITKDRTVLHELFMLTTLPFSRCILIGIANAIDLANRFLPRLESLNCKPTVLTFRAYSKDQILRILQDRLMAFPFTLFQPQALELCARKVAAASGDMRKALGICRNAIEMLEAEVKQATISEHLLSTRDESFTDQSVSISHSVKETNSVQVHHMALALSKAFRSPIVETIQSLPQHQQIFLCSAIKLFYGSKKVATIKELNKSYEDMCKSVKIRPVGISELSCICRVLGDQGLLKVGQSRKIDRVALQVDPADVTFALQGVRFFRSCLS